jgi:3-deoxy-7-phosphoheptulonate synthase
MKVFKDPSKKTTFQIGDLVIGKEFTFISGPCSIESKEQIDRIAAKMKEIGVHILRGGAFKPRTSPYSFQGLGKEGLEYLSEVKAKYQIPTISELTSETQLDLFNDIDIVQIGARNMQNYELLRAAGRLGKPVLLKRGYSSTIDEWLHAAEYIMSEGNEKVILCERGIRTFETSTRFQLDLTSIPALRQKTHLPIFVDPSHAAGNREYVIPLARAAAAVGCDGLIIESHYDPESALSDKEQTISFDQLEQLIEEVNYIIKK